MKKFAVLTVALLLLVARASAQFVTVDVVLDSDQFLPNEPLVAKVRISNSSGQTLRLGDDPNWLSFVLESSEGPYVKALREPDVAGAFELESSHTATKRVDLAPCFDLTKLGRYKIVATVRVPRFGTSYASPGKVFFISKGKPLWEKVFGMPEALSEKEGEPEVRKYVLVQALSGRDAKLYARVADRHDQNFRVVLLGSLVSFSKPEPQLDKWSNLHVLFETGARTFSYTVINPEGQVLVRETHEYTDNRPYMAANDEGRISIRGGNRRFRTDDVPPVNTAELPAPAPEPLVEPAPTLPEPTAKETKKKAANSANAKEKKKR